MDCSDMFSFCQLSSILAVICTVRPERRICINLVNLKSSTMFFSPLQEQAVRSQSSCPLFLVPSSP
jgi:hypothetical protein